MKDFSRERILVVGGAGFIGSHLVDSLAAENPESIHVVDNLFLGKEENLSEAEKIYPKLNFHKMDATENEIRDLIREEKISFVFNLATKALGYSFDDPADAFHVNVQIVSHLLESLRKKEIRNLIHFSSSEAYGTAVEVPMGEEHPLRPHTSYAAGKAAADLLIHSYQESFGVNTLIIRPFNNYGPRQNEGSYAALIPITIKKLLDGKSPVVHWDGKQTRDLIYVGDTVRLTVTLAKSRKLSGGVVNVGTGQEVSIYKVVNALCKIAGYNGKIARAPKRAGDVRRHCADILLLKSLVNDLSLKSLDEGLLETWKWYTRSKL